MWYASRRGMTDTQEATGTDADLRDQLKSMEAKLRRLRDLRQQHNDAGKRHADARNSIQKEYKKLREEIDGLLTQNKEIRNKAKAHQAKRDAIQQQVRELIGQAKNSRSEKGKKSPILELSEIQSQIDKLENMLETTGMKLEKENKVLKLVKKHTLRKKELEPLVAEEMRIKVDLDNIEGSIQELKSEADAEHAAMVELHKEADELWETIKPRFEERDFKKAEVITISCANYSIRTNSMGNYRGSTESKNLGFGVFVWGEIQALKDRAHQVAENSK